VGEGFGSSLKLICRALLTMDRDHR
jgi:hypothetical protein